MTFSLPVTEVCFGDSFYTLSNIFRGLADGEHFGAVSLLVLPLQNKSVFFELLNFTSKKNLYFHFPLEGFCGDLKKVIAWREEFLTLRTLSKPIDGNSGVFEKREFRL